MCVISNCNKLIAAKYIGKKLNHHALISSQKVSFVHADKNLTTENTVKDKWYNNKTKIINLVLNNEVFKCTENIS